MADDRSGNLPERRKPASGVRVHLGSPTIVFVTVCTRDRRPWLNDTAAVECLVDAWRAADAWRVGHYLAMPDHVHFFCSPHDLEHSLGDWVTYWKRIFGRRRTNPDWRWQTGQWDTRLRRGQSYSEKWLYVQQNPVRKCLVESSMQWPHQGTLNELRW